MEGSLLEADGMAKEKATPETIGFYTAAELRQLLENAWVCLLPVVRPGAAIARLTILPGLGA